MDPLYLEALATLETANGRKTVKGPKGEDSFNLYNIKDFAGGGFKAADKAEGSNDAYRAYPSRDAATADLIGLLSRKYPRALEAQSPHEFASALKSGGYATDPAYVEKFVNVANGLAGSGEREPIPVATAPAADRSLSALYAAAEGPRPPKGVALTHTARAVATLAAIAPVRGATPADTEAAWFTRSTTQEKDAAKAKAEADEQSVWDIARASWTNTFSGTVARRLSRDEYPPDGFVPTEEDLAGHTVEEQDALRQATSRQEYQRIKFDIEDSKDQQREAGKSGAGWAIAGGMIAGLPEAAAGGAATGAVLAKMGLGSLALAAQGRRLAALASATGENVGLGLGMTGVQDYLTPDVHMQDYLIGAVADLGLGVLPNLPHILHASRAVEAKALGRILDHAVAGKKADIDATRVRLGPDAEPAEVARATAEAQAARIRSTMETHTAGLPADRQLIPADVNEQLFGDVGAEKPTAPHKMEEFSLEGNNLAESVGVPEKYVNEPYMGRGVLSEDALDARTLQHLPSASEDNLAASWRRDNPYGRDAIRRFEQDYGLSYDELLRNAPERSVSVAQRGSLTSEQIKLAEWLHKTFMPEQRIVLADMAETPKGKSPEYANTHGDAWNIGRDISVVRIRNEASWQHAMIHEFGHVIFDRNVRAVKETVRDGFMSVHSAWLKRYAGSDGAKPAKGLSNAADAAVRRGPLSSDVVKQTLGVKAPDGFIPSLMDVLAGVVSRASNDVQALSPGRKHYGLDYIPSVQEFSAEQFTKYIEAAVADVLDWKPAARELAPVRQFFSDLWQRFANLFNTVKQAGLIAPEKGVVDFYETIRKSAKAGETRRARAEQGLDEYGHSFEAASPLDGPSAMMSSPGPATRTDADIARDYGLDILAADTPAQKAELKAMLHLYRKAEAYPMPDKARMSKLLSTAPMQWAAPTALALMNSKNPVARMVAAELIESGAGAGGRRTTASIAKWIHEREFMGNAVNDFQRHYTAWRNANGGGLREDYFGGKKFDEFNRRVAIELENRNAGRTTAEAQAVRDAADVLTQGYERMRMTQQRLKTPGWAALPPTSEGYMPHRMAPGKVRAMTPDQGRVLHGVLKDQFEQIEGFDTDFSSKLASKYIDIVRKRGTAGYAAPIGVHSAEAADIVEQSATAMGMSRDEANALAKRVLRAQPAHTRHRLQLDLTQSYEADGKPFQLIDLFETNQLTLMRSQASRVSGEAALVRHGIMGSTGMKLLRRALDFGTAEGKADNTALEAFDQVAAELLGQPFGKQAGKWLDRAMQFNSLASLGGMGFNQLAETLNGAVSLGARHALASVGSLRRLRSEILALSKGQSVNNPIIGSLETYGAEFGTDHYKMVFPFDNPDRGHEVYGVESLTAADRLLRSGSHLQGKLSLWRAITSAQERGMAEQIVHKALRYIRDGKEDVALADMGIDRQMIDSIRKELPNVAQFDSNGRLTQFDITKLEDRGAADAFVQAVHRGTKQIIQGAFIGETGKWAHNGFLKLLTQFRTFSLIAIDKQWNRQVGNHGTAAALGILLGTMSFAVPIVMIRAGITSLGRPDRDTYLEGKLHPVSLARDTLNYVALSGMAGDLLDALSAVAGYNPTGGRTGTNKSFVGNVIAPAAGKANDLWGAIQNSKDGTDLHGLAMQLPFSRLPWLYPAVNALKRDD